MSMPFETGGSAHLVAEITRKIVLSEKVAAAFLSVDRALFVQEYYVKLGGEWRLHTAGAEIYEAQPSSSSTQPSVMAAKLEALDLRPGQRLLEIGTGTGYNTALLAQIVGGTGCVITVEIEKQLAETAARRLESIGLAQVRVRCADGWLGYPACAPYERIIATASCETVPIAWMKQLATSGILVMNLVSRDHFLSVLVRLVKQADGTLSGVTLPTGASFMGLRSATPPDRSWMPERYDLEGTHHIDMAPQLLQALRHDRALLFFLHAVIPSLSHRMQYRDGPRNATTSYDLCFHSNDFLLVVCEDGALMRGNVKSLILACQHKEAILIFGFEKRRDVYKQELSYRGAYHDRGPEA
jgi:protein-L-isoaspartate(D-aspartate) O-methyltransferase